MKRLSLNMIFILAYIMMFAQCPDDNSLYMDLTPDSVGTKNPYVFGSQLGLDLISNGSNWTALEQAQINDVLDACASTTKRGAKLWIVLEINDIERTAEMYDYCPIDLLSGKSNTTTDGNQQSVFFEKDDDPQTYDNGLYLSENYPEPFTTGTSVEFFIPEEDGYGDLIVYNLQGKKLIAKRFPYGKHSYIFNNLPKGLFIYGLTTSSGQIFKKMVKVGDNE
jgi:hypothetical protein